MNRIKLRRNLATFLSLLFVVSGCTSSSVKTENKISPVLVLTKFYEKYLTELRSQPQSRSALPYSQSLKELMAENVEVCKQSPPGDMCGYGSDGDIYIDAQDFGEKLTFTNSQFKASEVEPGLTRVEFDLDPPERSHYNHRRIDFKMRVEGGEWVVDDIIYPNGNLRTMIIQEIHEIRKTHL